MKKVIVLGGTGFVGSHLCEKLVRAGWKVTVPTRRRSNAQAIQHLPGLSVVELDVHDPKALAEVVKGHVVLVNLVAILHGTLQQFERVHVALPHSVAQACLHAGVRQVVHVSALGANALQPETLPSMYLRTKSEGEAVLIQAASGAGAGPDGQKGFDLSLLRPSVIFGAGDKFLNVFANLQRVLPLIPLAGADAHFQPVWVQDVADAVVACLQGRSSTPSPRVIEACGPDVFTLRELVRLAGRAAGVGGGCGRPVLALPEWAARLQATLMGLAPGEPVMTHDNLDSMKVDNVASGQLPGLDSLGLRPAALEPIACDYLRR